MKLMNIAVREINRKSPKDYHNHVCPKCQTIWRHSSENVVDNIKAHSCPRCSHRNYTAVFRHPGRDPDYLDWNGDR